MNIESNDGVYDDFELGGTVAIQDGDESSDGNSRNASVGMDNATKERNPVGRGRVSSYIDVNDVPRFSSNTISKQDNGSKNNRCKTRNLMFASKKFRSLPLPRCKRLCCSAGSNQVLILGLSCLVATLCIMLHLFLLYKTAYNGSEITRQVVRKTLVAMEKSVDKKEVKTMALSSRCRHKIFFKSPTSDNCYYFSNFLSPWVEAMEFCVGFGGNLVTVDGNSTEWLLRSVVPNSTLNTYWVGLHLPDSEKLYLQEKKCDDQLKWSEAGKENSTYRNWKLPPTASGCDSGCVMWTPAYWFLASCSQLRKFICDFTNTG